MPGHNASLHPNRFLARRPFFAPLLRKPSPLVSRRRVISIIDDDMSIRQALKRLMKSAGVTVEVFASAEEFLFSGRSQDSACLILDLRLPGISGLDLQRQLLITNPQLPIIFISAHGDEDAKEKALRSGAIDFLQKPFNEKALFAAINSSLLRSARVISSSCS